MLLRNLTQVWVSEYEEINNHGEKEKTWKFKGKKAVVKNIDNVQTQEIDSTQVSDLDNLTKGLAYLNLQQDVNELDRKSSGEVDYSIYKARTEQSYDIQKGNGISLTDISAETNFVPEYRVIDINLIGNTIVYRLEKYNGD